MVYIIGGIVALLAVGLVVAVVFYVLKARKRSVYWSFSFFLLKGKLQKMILFPGALMYSPTRAQESPSVPRVSRAAPSQETVFWKWQDDLSS